MFSFLLLFFSKLAFGSCHNPWLDSALTGYHWKQLVNLEPQVFFWTGDAVYSKSRSPEGLRQAYGQFDSNSPSYKAFVRTLSSIDGTMDDHDFGANE